MPQLDALRALAVLGVMVHHFYPRASEFVPLGMGVRLFFSLSGFLITGILLDCREMVEATGQGWGVTLRRFYIRRSLRIFPIYYLVLALLWLGRVPDARQSMGWHLAYLSNVHFARKGTLDWVMGHLWTLSVEEQFYLVWPWFVLLLPRRALTVVAVAAILIGPAYRYRAAVLGWKPETAATLTLANVDVLATGALLAILTSSAAASSVRGSNGNCNAQRPSAPSRARSPVGYTNPEMASGVTPIQEARRTEGVTLIDGGGGVRRFTRPARVGLAVRLVGFGIGLPALIALLTLHVSARLHGHHAPRIYFVGLNTAMALTFTAVIDAAAVGIRGPVGAALRWRVLRYIGKISYGLYLYHNLMPVPLGWAFQRLGWIFPETGVGRLALCAAASFAVAIASWHLLENPVNSLKRYFPYKQHR